MTTAIKNAVVRQFRGRRTAWIVAVVLSSVVIAAWFHWLQPKSCDLIFHPAEVAKGYAIAWVCLVVFIGLTMRAKIVFAVVVLLWLGSGPLIHYRIPANESSTVRRLVAMHDKLRSANAPMVDLSKAIDSELGENRRRSGYQYHYSQEVEGGGVKHYQISARPQSYCTTGQRSFIIDESGVMHYTSEDRAATKDDRVVKMD